MLTRVTGRVLTARLRLLFKLGPLKLQKLESEYAQDSGLRTHKVQPPSSLSFSRLIDGN